MIKNQGNEIKGKNMFLKKKLIIKVVKAYNIRVLVMRELKLRGIVIPAIEDTST